MPIYANLSGTSGVASYEVGADFIIVNFRNGQFTRYHYTYASLGSLHVEAMKTLAEQGYGLNSYISSNPIVRKGYSLRE